MNFEGSMSVTTFLMIDNLEQLCIRSLILKYLIEDMQNQKLPGIIRNNPQIIYSLNLYLRSIKHDINSTEDKIEDEMGFSEFENFIDDFYKSPIDIFKDIHLIRKLRKYSKITTDQLKKKRLKYHNKLVSILMENIDYMSNDIIELVLKIKKNLIAIHKIIYS